MIRSVMLGWCCLAACVVDAGGQNTEVVYIDGGVVFQDGGTIVVDGGVGVIDGGIEYLDGGPLDRGILNIDGGVVVIDGGIETIDAGKEGIDGGVVTIDGGIRYADGGIFVIDGGLQQIDGGVAHIDGGVRQIDGGVAYIDGGVRQVDGGVAYIDGGVQTIDGGVGCPPGFQLCQNYCAPVPPAPVAGLDQYYTFDDTLNCAPPLNCSGIPVGGGTALYTSGVYCRALQVNAPIDVPDEVWPEVTAMTHFYLPAMPPSGIYYMVNNWQRENFRLGVEVNNGIAQVFGSFHEYLSPMVLYFEVGIISPSNPTPALTSGRWYHAALTYQTPVLILYLDGVEVGRAVTNTSMSYSVPSIPNADTLLAGGGGTAFFPGSLDDVRIFDRALTASEIQSQR